MPRVPAFLACLFLLGFMTEWVVAECPSERDIPVMYDSTTYLGCYYYPQGNAENAIQACDTGYTADPDGYDYTPEDPSWSLYDHALVIRPGCTVYEFSQPDFQGDVTEIHAGVNPNVLSHFQRYSYKVRCDIEHIDCQPNDGYSIVLLCDALDAVVDSECTYVKTIGTTYTESITNSMSLDESLEVEMKASFFSLFSENLGVSVNTGYDWTQVSESASGETESFTVKAVAPAGYVVTIDQALGQCGGSGVNTELFRITQKSQDGDTKVKYVKAARNNAPLV